MNISVIEENIFEEHSSLRYDIARITLKGQSERGEGQTRIEENQQESAGEEEGRTKGALPGLKRNVWTRPVGYRDCWFAIIPPARRLGVLIVMQRTIRTKLCWPELLRLWRDGWDPPGHALGLRGFVRLSSGISPKHI